jgi:uncharacterized protein (TIGR04255 family)
VNTVLTPDPLPDFPRVIYEVNPLTEVICQFRFPAILRIAAEPPVAFQERIRAEFPLLKEQSADVGLQIPSGLPSAVADMVKVSLRKRQVGYDFMTADSKWKVSLTRDFLALSTSGYLRWEGMKEHLQGPLRALLDVYKPAFFGRIGLRYQDVIRRSALKLDPSTRWSELLQPHIVGLLGTGIYEEVTEVLSQALIKLPHFAGQVRLNYGVVVADDPNEECFLIDHDFFTEQRTETDDVDRILAYFNRQSGRLFRWCIQDRLHEAMRPIPVETSA